MASFCLFAGMVCVSFAHSFIERRRESRAKAEAERKTKKEEQYQQRIKETARTPGPRVLRPHDWGLRRDFALHRDNHQCQQCGSQIALHVHHIKAASASRDHSGSNLITLCIYCHAKQPGPGDGAALLSRTIKSRMKKHHLVRHRSRTTHRCEHCNADIHSGDFNYRQNYPGGAKLCEKCVYSLAP